MRSFLTTLLFAGLIFLASCNTKDDGTPDLLTVPSADSVSKGSYMKLLFSPTDSILVNDLTVKSLPIEVVSATNTYDPTDSTYILRIILADNKSKLISLNLNAKNSSSDPLTTTYLVTENTSTLTDFRAGENKTYGIVIGSSVTLTKATYPFEGSMDLMIRYNMVNKEVTGTFYITR